MTLRVGTLPTFSENGSHPLFAYFLHFLYSYLGANVKQPVFFFFFFFFLGRIGVVASGMKVCYRKHSFIVIMLVAAIVTPPVLTTLILVSIPLYLLYDVSIRVLTSMEHSFFSKHALPAF